MKYFRFLCWVPAATWVWARVEVDRYDGWGAWAAAPLLLGPVAISALFVATGLLMLSRRNHRRRGPWDSTAIGVAALPLLWIALRLIAS